MGLTSLARFSVKLANDHLLMILISDDLLNFSDAMNDFVSDLINSLLVACETLFSALLTFFSFPN